MAIEEPAGPGPGDLLLAALALAPFAVDWTLTVYDWNGLPQAAFMGAAAAAIGAWYALRAARSERPLELKLTPWHAALALFLLWCGLSGLWARSRWEWLELWRHWLAAGAAGALVAAAGRRPARWALAALFASAAAQAALCLCQYFRLGALAFIPQAVPPGGTFGHRSFAMEWLLLGAPFGALLWERARRPAAQWALALALGLVTGVIALSNARACWLGLAAEVLSLAAWLAWTRGREGALPGPARPRWASAAAGLLAALLLISAQRAPYARQYGGYAERLSGMLQGLSGSPALEDGMPHAPVSVNNVRMRLAIWRNSLAIVAGRRWRGVGLGDFAVQYPWFSRAAVYDGITGTRYYVDHAHNEALQVYVETGAVGALLALAVLGAAGMASGRLALAADPEDRAWAAGCAAALTGILVESLFVFPFHLALPPMAACVLMGLAAARGEGRALPLRSRPAAAAAAALALLCAASLYVSSRQMEASTLYGEAHLAMRTLGQYPAAPANVAPLEWARRKAGVLTAAFDDLSAATGLYPDPEYIHALGGTLGKMGRVDEAILVLVPLAMSHPNNIGILVDASLALTSKGRLDEALQAAGRAVNIYPNPTALNALGLAQYAKGLYPDAARSFARASAAAPEVIDLPLREGLAWKAAGDRLGARAAFERALAVDPASAKVKEALASLSAPGGQVRARRP